MRILVIWLVLILVIWLFFYGATKGNREEKGGNLVKINFECTIAGEKLSGSFTTDNKNGDSFILSKHREEIIKDVISRSIEITAYPYEIC